MTLVVPKWDWTKKKLGLLAENQRNSKWAGSLRWGFEKLKRF
jgi:hypothetical protein